MEASLIAALLLGFVSSAHCVGMCGPLVLSMPVRHLSEAGRWSASGLYHAGRIGVYALGGLVFGLAGHQFVLAGWQQGLSVLLGSLILCRLVWRSQWLPVNRFSIYLQRTVTRLWNASFRGKYFFLGAATGLLPCGMVYIALAAALTTDGPLRAAGFMAFFGLGTLPMLLGLQVTGRMVGMSTRMRLRRAIPYVTALTAVLLILRGLNLGIPYVSPVLAGRAPQAIGCH
jgi:sulfite exporter TauE/SafE